MKTRGLFVTGTDTGVGKTAVAALILRESRAMGRSVGAYKPVCSGAEHSPGGEPTWHDVDELSRAIGGSAPRERIGPQCFAAPVAPPVAARMEGRSVDARLLRDGARWWTERVELLVVEGAGGLLCPLTDSESMADLAADLGYPLVIVTRLGLGCINHTLLTVEVARSRRLAVAGIVFNEVEPPLPEAEQRAERDEIARRGRVPILGRIRYNRPDRLLREAATERMNWWEAAAPSSFDPSPA